MLAFVLGLIEGAAKKKGIPLHIASSIVKFQKPNSPRKNRAPNRARVPEPDISSYPVIR
jgi:hypothetical protein